MLIHREYASGEPARLIIEYGKVTTYNANRPHGFGVLDPDTFAPYPKNPVIGAFFREIDRADELGSGMRNMMQYGKKYGGSDPQLIEGDIFRMVISVPEFTEEGSTGKSPAVTTEVTPEVTTEVTTEVRKLLAAIKGEMDRVSLQRVLGLKAEKNFRLLYLQPALRMGLIERTIPDKPRSRMQKYRLTAKGKAVLHRGKG